MADIATVNLHQPAVYWKRTGFNTSGQGIYADPIQVMTRWERHVSTSTESDKGPISLVFTVFVECEILNGSKLWKGCLKDLPANLDLRKVPQTRDYDEVPDIDGKNPQRTCIAS
jgi:hypothetical protein